MSIFYWDEKAMAIVKQIENAIIPLHLDSQGEFIALANAIDFQFESGEPVPDVVRLLGEAVLALAQARGLPAQTQSTLAKKVSALNDRLRTTARSRPGR